jgi:hypothetical protein
MRNKIQETAFIYTEEQLDKDIGLPERKHHVLYPELTPQQKKHYKSIEKDWVTTLDSGESVVVKWVMEKSMKMRQILDGFMYHEDEVLHFPCGKLNSLERLVTKNFAKAKKIVIWAAFKESIKLIVAMLEKNKIVCHPYYGEMSDEDKDQAKNDFKNLERVRAIVAQSGCGIGLNEFVVSNVSIYYSNTDRRRHRRQSEKRTIRTTQRRKSVYIVDFVSAPIEQTMLDNLEKKGTDSKFLLSYRSRKKMKREIK